MFIVIISMMGAFSISTCNISWEPEMDVVADIVVDIPCKSIIPLLPLVWMILNSMIIVAWSCAIFSQYVTDSSSSSSSS